MDLYQSCAVDPRLDTGYACDNRSCEVCSSSKSWLCKRPSRSSSAVDDVEVVLQVALFDRFQEDSCQHGCGQAFSSIHSGNILHK